MGLGDNEWKEHAEMIGRVTLGWNRNVHQLLRVFCHLTGLGAPLAETIFFSHQNDRSQRLLLKRIAEAVQLPDKDQLSLEGQLKKLDKIAIGRNLATHTIFGVTLFDPVTGAWGPKVVPALTPQDPRLKQDFKAQFEQVETDLAVIYQALEEWLAHTPFPERPWGIPALLGVIPINFEPEPSLSDDPADWPS